MAQHRLSTSGQAIVNESNVPVLLRGMGLGGWMLQEGYMLQMSGFANPQHEIRETISALIGPESTDAFYAEWLQNHVSKADIDAMKSWGFNSVRLPLHYNLFTLPIEQESEPGENTWLDTGFQLTDSLVSWCKQNEMYVILDLHAAPGGQGHDAAISDYDASKPSLWESQDNRDKMAALWKRIATHYAAEDWVAGYDLLNEPNWELPGGTALRDLYVQCTDSIRSVDPNHILFIEGNWWANDFTGLTPPWDDHVVYSPHKYWNFNDSASLGFALELREEHDVPLYLGESGENSNVWYREAIHLLESFDIGWAWWPLKKVGSVTSPLSVELTEGYQNLLDHWNGNGPAPSVEAATAVLMDLAEKVSFEHCEEQRDVVDAMFRQIQSEETLPFVSGQVLPGVLHATDYDLGAVGNAYGDGVVANYYISTGGDYTAWNNGWQYRNDGVDITSSSDAQNSNGYKVGWIDTGDWMKYSVEVQEGGLYDVAVRTAAWSSQGAFHLELDGADVTSSTAVFSTGQPGDWQTVNLEGVHLAEGLSTVVFRADLGGLDVSHFDFSYTGTPSDEADPMLVSAKAIGPHLVEVTCSKSMQEPAPSAIEDIVLFADGEPMPLLSTGLHPTLDRIFLLYVEDTMDANMLLTLSYSGQSMQGVDGNPWGHFSLEPVTNDLANVDCDSVLGHVSVDGGCEVFMMCESLDGSAQGVTTLHASLEQCALAVSDGCVSQVWLDLGEDAVCTFEYIPVCGCDGLTYSNACQAQYFGGNVTWELGACPDPGVVGCTYPAACNYDSSASVDDGSCLFPPEHCPFPDGTNGGGCTYVGSNNFNEDAAWDDGTCTFDLCSNDCPADLNQDELISVTDVLMLLGQFGDSCE